MARPFSVVAADLPGSGGERPRAQAGSRHAGSAALMARECVPLHTLGITDPGQARGFLLCFHCQCSWSLPCLSCRGGLALNGLREQLAKTTPAVCTFELFIPSRVLVIRHYLFGGACSDVERGKCLPRAMNRSFLVHLPGTPTPSNCRGWAQRLPSCGFYPPSDDRACSWDLGLSPRWSCVTSASTAAPLRAPY